MAATPGGREAIEKEMDETRERLAQTIDQLVHRSSPKTIASRQVAAIKGSFVDPSGQPRTDNIVKVVGGIVVVVVVLGIVRKVVGKD